MLHHPAVYRYHLAGYVRRVLGAEEPHNLRDLLGRLLLERSWLAKQPGIGKDPDPLLSSLALKEIYFLRLLATQFRYELALHSDKSPEKMDVVFSDMIAEHCSVRFAPEAYLFLTDFHWLLTAADGSIILAPVLEGGRLQAEEKAVQSESDRRSVQP